MYAETQFITMTGSQLEAFATLVAEKVLKAQAPAPAQEDPRYIYGIQGLSEYLHCSKSTAQKLKNTTLRKAVRQCGRIIVFDRNLVDKLIAA